MSAFGDGGGYFFNGKRLIKVPIWEPKVIATIVELAAKQTSTERSGPDPVPWKSQVDKIIGLAQMERVITKVAEADMQKKLAESHAQQIELAVKDLATKLERLATASGGGGSQPNPDDPGDDKGPWGPYGPGGPIMMVADFLLNVAMGVPAGIVRGQLLKSTQTYLSKAQEVSAKTK